MKSKYEDFIFDTKHGKVKVLDFHSYNDVLVQFMESGYIRRAGIDSLKADKVKDRSVVLVQGVGKNDGTCPTRINKVKTREYRLWENMLTRSCSLKFKTENATYKSVSISQNFLEYAYFYEWCQKQYGFNKQEWQLDKDLRSGCVYSEDNCVFLPREVNNLLATIEHKGYYLSKRNKFVVDVVCEGISVCKSFEDEGVCRSVIEDLKQKNAMFVLHKYKGELNKDIYQELLSKFGLLED